MKNKYFMLITSILFFIVACLGLYRGYDSPQQWRQSFSIIGFILALAIFLTSVIIFFKKGNSSSNAEPN